MFFEQAQVNSLGQWLGIIVPTNRIYFVYIISAIVIAFFAYWQIERAHDDHDEDDGERGAVLPERPSSFFAFVFDPRVLLHPSTIQDVKFFLVNAIVYAGIATQFLITTQGVAWYFNRLLEAGVGPLETPIMSGATSLVVYTILSVLMVDLAVYIAHRLMHKVPLLWHFHAVHHSAEQLNPLTLFRMHPVDLAITSVTVAIFTGAAYAGLFYLTGEQPQALTIWGLNVIFMLFYVFGYNLRHSHIWLNYPAWVSHIFVSPAQHQIHHSSDPKHFDKNMGLIFAFWDGLFGTLYVPKTYEKINFGLNRENPNPFNSVAELYFKPFVWARQTLAEMFDNRVRRYGVYGGLASLAIGVVLASGYLKDKQPGFNLPSVMLADLTWTDAHQALSKGYDTIIVPTGGTEQNGPFVALGKHNFIIEKTAAQIAEAVGNTLVAPVMDYVPEGQIEPVPQGHMAYTGTLSLPENVFEDVLIATAKSLRAHGFKNIMFLGESGDSQASQARVANQLQKLWADEGMRVATVTDYYYGNGQVEHLQAKGYSTEQIGTHAGIRDTSELMYISGDNVRMHNSYFAGTRKVGLNGDYTKASKSIGAEMIALKIEAGVAQIKSILDQAPAADTDKGVIALDGQSNIDPSPTAAFEQ